MSKDLNKMMATGRLGQDPILKYTPNGSAVVTFSVASNRKWKDAEGDEHEDVEWVRCVGWTKLAEICGQYLHQGDKVYVEGRLQTRSWDDADTGQKRFMTEVVLNDMIMLESKGARTNGFTRPEEDEMEARTTKAAPAKAARSATPPTTDDDLPF